MIIIKGKKIRWIILGVCLILFTTIMIFVITKNKLYVALTRAKNKVYIITKEIFDIYKKKYLK